MTTSTRFSIQNDRLLGEDVYHIIDNATPNGHITATTFNTADAELLLAKLNDKPAHPRLRQLIACELADFRMRLEHENGAPLNQYPDIAMVLDKLCDFLGFTTGERALALGPHILVYLAGLEEGPDVLDYASSAITVTYLDRAASGAASGAVGGLIPVNTVIL